MDRDHSSLRITYVLLFIPTLRTANSITIWEADNAFIYQCYFSLLTSSDPVGRGGVKKDQPFWSTYQIYVTKETN